MPSLDFEHEQNQFRKFYDSSYHLFENANNSFVTLVNALVSHSGNIAFSKVEGRVKEKEECIRKFNRKYRTELERNTQTYSIKDHISDLIGLRIVCLYEDDIDTIGDILREHFDVIEVTNKIALIEETEGSFGYKGLHLDLKLGELRRALPEYVAYADFSFEIQIRTIIQDSWSTLDHKIKYKKSIPNRLKRRINTLAALFEMADREFKEIRDSTEEEIKKAEAEAETETDSSEQEIVKDPKKSKSFTRPVRLNAFTFLKIAQHFFKGYDFEPHKVDRFTQEIVVLEPEIDPKKLNTYMQNNISKVKKYKSHFEKIKVTDRLNPYTSFRHCLYLGNREKFRSVLTNVARESFELWLSDNND